MKKLIIYVMVFATMGLASVACNSDDEPEIPAPVEEVKIPAISRDEAVEVAMKAMVNFGYATDASASDVKVTVNSCGDEDTAFYVVSYPKGGYVAVDGNGAAPVKVLAINGTGEFDTDFYLKASRPRAVDQTSAAPVLPDGIAKVYQFTTPSWDGGLPFSSENENFKAFGFGPVAIGEILAYYKKSILVDGKPFDWTGIDPFDLNDESQKKVNKLLKQIGVDFNAVHHINYDINFSKIGEGLKQYGYNNCRYFSFTPDSNFPDYFKNGPVLMHATEPVSVTVVVDGFLYNAENVKDAADGSETTAIALYCRVNWGCSGEGNGYYLFYYYYTKDNGESVNMVALPEGTEFLTVQ